MKSAQEILEHVRDLMARMYEHPERFARTPSELNVALRQIHHMWGYITERDGEIQTVHLDLCKVDYPNMPDGFFDPSSKPSSQAWKQVAQHWQNVDAALGIASD